MLNLSTISAILLSPLASFLLLGLGSRRIRQPWSGYLATIVMVFCAVASLLIAWQYFYLQPTRDHSNQYETLFRFPWLVFNDKLTIDISLVIDPLTIMMLVVVTFVSAMVHIFSLAYMKGEERYTTYFAFLGLFTFSMLGLILAGNLFQIYICWELVGVSSFLLIGYYFTKPSAVAAAKKAFIVTRFADLGFLIGILVLSFYGESLDMATLVERLGNPADGRLQSAQAAGFLGLSAFSWGLLLIFAGGAGKSAMFPLHIWLPDAMEGPTPVSALIHAATMVVAGVFLVARLFGIFILAADVMQIITFIGAFSALFAAVIACTQTDIKRILAYSTMSQIGYMMFSLGIASASDHYLGYTSSLFHLFTHAFFKSLLFLGAGAVIHLVHSNELSKMGGLRKQLPLVHLSFLIACLSIAGVFPLAGFYSKEEILLASFGSNRLVFSIALLTAGLTAFYMFRLYFSVFWGKSSDKSDHAHGSFFMSLPLALLTICTIGAGWLPFGSAISFGGEGHSSTINWLFSLAPLSISAVGIFIAYKMYCNPRKEMPTTQPPATWLHRAAFNKFYIDEAYRWITGSILFPLVGRPFAWFDRTIVDGIVQGVANAVGNCYYFIRGMQSGKLQDYLLYFMGGIVAWMIFFMYIWK
jgi:NADH-quinone oxidoreductase subunit L